MYSKKPYIARSYNLTKHSIDSMPLGEFSESYTAIREAILSSYNNDFSARLERERLKFIERYNAINESSYEGSFEEADLEGKVIASIGSAPDPSGHPDILAHIEDFAKKMAIARNAEWFFSQAIARFGQLPLETNDIGYSAKALYLDHIKDNPELRALWLLFRYQKRSSLLDKQTDPKYRNFSSLVPLIMSAFKQYNNIPYEKWDANEIHGIVETNLAKAMLVQEIPELDRDEVLQQREFGLTVRTGEKAGTIRNPATTYSLYLGSDSPLAELPTLARIMVCQVWCAHPSNRTKLMILNPVEWDNMPTPLVWDTVFTTSTPSTTKYQAAMDTPW